MEKVSLLAGGAFTKCEPSAAGRNLEARSSRMGER